MPSRKALVNILFPRRINDETVNESWLVEKVMAWATPDRVEVREKIIKVVKQYAGKQHYEAGYSVCIPKEDYIDALTNALCGEEEPKWCSHFQLGSDGVWNLLGQLRLAPGYGGEAWTVCPICATPRPIQP